MSDNFIDDLEFTTQYQINPNLLKSYYHNPLDVMQKNEMQKYINTNIIDFLMIDNLLQNVKLDNGNYLLHEELLFNDNNLKKNQDIFKPLKNKWNDSKELTEQQNMKNNTKNRKFTSKNINFN